MHVFLAYQMNVGANLAESEQPLLQQNAGADADESISELHAPVVASLPNTSASESEDEA